MLGAGYLMLENLILENLMLDIYFWQPPMKHRDRLFAILLVQPHKNPTPLRGAASIPAASANNIFKNHFLLMNGWTH
jgi:hypothetical protein